MHVLIFKNIEQFPTKEFQLLPHCSFNSNMKSHNKLITKETAFYYSICDMFLLQKQKTSRLFTYRVYKSSPLECILIQLNPIHILNLILLRNVSIFSLYSNYICCLPNVLFRSGFPQTLRFAHQCYMLHPSQS